MDDAAMRASVAEYERNLQLKVRRPLTQWVNALEGVRVGDAWLALVCNFRKGNSST